MKEKFAQMMAGRYGGDRFGRFLSFASLVPLLLSLAFDGPVRMALWAVTIAMIIYEYCRMFSRKIAARKRENEWYLRRRQAVTGFFAAVRGWIFQGRKYRFFRCPKCGVWLRVPRGRGKIRVTCRGCGEQFIKTV